MADIASDLKERFNFAAYWYQSAWEFDPDASIVDNVIVRDQAKEDADDRMIESFESLRDSVDAIPITIIAKADVLRTAVGPEKYENILGDAIIGIGREKHPKDATEFLGSLILSLQFAA